MRQQGKLKPARIAAGLMVCMLTFGLRVVEAAPAGYAAGMELTSAVCGNDATEQSVTDLNTMMGLFDCASAGMELDPGQGFSVVLTGEADPVGGGSIGMEVTSGGTVDQIECSNTVTGASVTVIPDIDFAGWFGCTEAGLEVQPFQGVVITVGGVAP